MSPDIMNAAELLWRYHCIYDSVEPSEFIIGLGGRDLRVADRCIDLYRQGLAPRLIFTGHCGHWIRDRFDVSEARGFADRAIARGVPPDVILLEERATNIGENIAFSSAIAGEHAGVILVSKPQTQRRCLATAGLHWPKATVRITAPLNDLSQQPTANTTMRQLICEMVGDLKRIQIYPEAGFQIPQPIPDEVLLAHRFLVDQGFIASV